MCKYKDYTPNRWVSDVVLFNIHWNLVEPVPFISTLTNWKTVPLYNTAVSITRLLWYSSFLYTFSEQRLQPCQCWWCILSETVVHWAVLHKTKCCCVIFTTNSNFLDLQRNSWHILCYLWHCLNGIQKFETTSIRQHGGALLIHGCSLIQQP